MEFKQLRSFVTVAEQSSFTKAARILYISQPTISTHIRQLEAELNASLIIRTTKNVELTAKGQEVYGYAVSILNMQPMSFRKSFPLSGVCIRTSISWYIRETASLSPTQSWIRFMTWG